MGDLANVPRHKAATKGLFDHAVDLLNVEFITDRQAWSKCHETVVRWKYDMGAVVKHRYMFVVCPTWDDRTWRRSIDEDTCETELRLFV